MRFRLMMFIIPLALAACGQRGVPSTASSALQSSAPPSISAKCSIPAPVATAPGVLPAPVYFLGNNSQIWRLEPDGSTLTQITNEPQPIRYFDVAPATGALAYISGNALFCADGRGGGRALLVEGPALSPTPDDTRIANEMNRVAWSPDGTHIAYGLDGVNIFDVSAGASTAALQNDSTPTDFSTPVSGPIRLFSPSLWSPDGSRLLVNVSFFPEGGGLAVFNPADKSLVQITNPAGQVCCYSAWSGDSKSIYFANDTIGVVTSGLWRADAATGEATTLIAGDANGAFALVSYPFALPDGQLAYFFVTTPTFPDGFIPLAMTRSGGDGVTARVALRADTSLPYEALWSPDGSGAVIVNRVGQTVTQEYPYIVYGPLVWLKADGSAPLALPAQGFSLRWGK